jgi:Tol biopolymer transport system component
VDALSWSPDGSSLVFGVPEFSTETPGSTLYVVAADSTGVTTIPGGHAASWSPDGGWLAVAGFDGRVFLARPDGSETVDVFGPADRPAGGGPPAWLPVEAVRSPDGTPLALATLAPVVTPAAVATPRPQATDAVDSVGLIVYVRGDEIRTLDPVTGRERLVLREPAADQFPTFWSQDGRFIIFDDGAAAITPDGNALFRTASRQGGGPASWSADASRYAMVAESDAGPRIEIHDVTGAIVDSVDAPAGLTGVDLVAWAPDGRSVAILGSTCTGDVCTCESKSCYRTATGEVASSVWLVPIDGSAARLLTEQRTTLPGPGVSVSLPQMPWSPDGSRLTWQESGCDSETCWQALVAGEIGSGTSDRLDGAWFQSWSPDGSTMAVGLASGTGDAQRGLFLVDADGRGLRQVTGEPDFLPVWSGDGGWLAFGRPREGYGGETGSIADLEVWIARTDGTGARRVISGTNNFDWQHPGGCCQ